MEECVELLKMICARTAQSENRQPSCGHAHAQSNGRHKGGVIVTERTTKNSCKPNAIVVVHGVLDGVADRRLELAQRPRKHLHAGPQSAMGRRA